MVDQWKFRINLSAKTTLKHSTIAIRTVETTITKSRYHVARMNVGKGEHVYTYQPKLLFQLEGIKLLSKTLGVSRTTKNSNEFPVNYLPVTIWHLNYVRGPTEWDRSPHSLWITHHSESILLPSLYLCLSTTYHYGYKRKAKSFR